MKKFKLDTAYDYVFVNCGHFSKNEIEYMTPDSYQDTYPENKCKIDGFIIKRVCIRNKQYTNADDAYKDVYNICKDKKIK